MTRILRSAFVSLFAVGVAASLTGCKVDCDQEENKTTCIGESTVPYTGSEIAQEVAWSDGQRLTVAVAGGDIRVGDTASTSITVNPHSSGGAKPATCTDVNKVCIRFIPINNDTKDRRDEATRQMKQVADGGNLQTSAGTDANGVVATVTQNAQNGKYNNSLSATVDVWVPDAFNGDVVAKSDSGGISVRGARKGATVQTGLGDIAFDLTNVIATTTDNTITSDHGDITFNIPKASNLNIQGTASGIDNEVYTSTADGWKLIEGSTAQAATFCGNAACTGSPDGLWKLNAKFGSVKINPS